MPNLDPIVNKAIPLSFPGVKCAATINIEQETALRRREQLKADILTLLQNQQHDRGNDKDGVADRAY